MFFDYEDRRQAEKLIHEIFEAGRRHNLPWQEMTYEGLTIRPRGNAVYELSPYPFVADNAEFAFAGRLISPQQAASKGGWPTVLRELPTRWESFRLVAA